MKILQVKHGPKSDQITAEVKLLGEIETAVLTPAMARRAARTETGGVRGVTVMDVPANYGYIIHSESSHTKIYIEQ